MLDSPSEIANILQRRPRRAILDRDELRLGVGGALGEDTNAFIRRESCEWDQQQVSNGRVILQRTLERPAKEALVILVLPIDRYSA